MGWQPMMDALAQSLDVLRRSYIRGNNDLEEIGQLAFNALNLLASHANTRELDHWPDAPEGERFYDVFAAQNRLSRPIRRDLFINDPNAFEASWEYLTTNSTEGGGTICCGNCSAVLYTCIQSLAAAYDLFRPSPKPPGTSFEIMVGTLAAHVSGLARRAQIRLPREGHRVTTDIVLELREGGPGLVLPCKITTRERMVQVFAHQRILDNVFGEGTYRSALVCVSETQRNGSKGVQEICVPTQIEIFQKHLAKLEGLYYLDPPTAYVQARFAQDGFRPRLLVQDLSVLFTSDLANLVTQLRRG
jgi:hypothetical protein